MVRLEPAGLAGQGVGAEMAMVEEGTVEGGWRATAVVSTAETAAVARAKAMAEGKAVALASRGTDWRARARCRRRGRRFR